jgi:hypothetical protein
VDLDGDGIPDIISGSWPGELFFFRGLGKGQYAAPIKLKNKLGKTINIGGGLRKESGMILVAGDAKYEDTPKGRVIVYEGERIEIPEGKDAGTTGMASTVFAFDWDGDGLLDLLVGTIDGNVYLVPNEGTSKQYAFGKERRLEANGEPIEVGGDAHPIAADWDGDGLPDLLVGAGDGSVRFYRNIGTRRAPKLAAPVTLVASRERGEAPKEPMPGTRAKICVVDWDGDGRPDLLVGDFATQRAVHPEPTKEQKAAHDKAREELKKLQKRAISLYEKRSGDNRVKDPAERKKVQEELDQIHRQTQKLHEVIPSEYEYHGWVWLYRRKGPEAKASP